MDKTRGYANFRGKIYGLENALKEMKESKKGNFNGRNYFANDTIIKLKLRIKTSEENSAFLEIVQFKKMMSGEVKLFSTEKGNRDSKTVNWEQRYDFKKQGDQEGFETFGVRVKVDSDSEVQNLFPIDAIKAITENFQDGDSVFVGTEMSHQTYKDAQQNVFAIQRIFKSKDEIDFEAENFNEVSDFQAKTIFSGVVDLGDELLVNGFYVDFKGDMIGVSYVACDPDLIDYFKSSVSYGDGLEVEGVVHNRVTYKESDSADNTGGAIVGKRAGSFNNNKVREIDSEKRYLEIYAITSHVQGMYIAELDALNSANQPDTANGDSEGAMPWD